MEEYATVVDLVEAHASAGPDRWSVVTDDGSRTTGREQFGDDVARVAAVLADLGVRPGARVALSISNRYDFLLAWFATNWLGAVFVPLNIALKPREAAYILNDSEAVLWLIDPNVPDVVDTAERLDPAARPRRVLSIDEVVKEAASATPRAPVHTDGDRPAGLLYTSGTTGTPKGCVCPHSYYLITGRRYAERIGLGEEDVLSTCLPLFHMNAQTLSVSASLQFGVPLVVHERFSATTFFSDAARHEATIFNYIGAIPAILFAREPAPSDRAHTLRLGFGGGIPLDLHGPFEERFGVVCVEGFGMTETGACLSVPTTGDRKIGSGACGVPYPGLAAQVVDPDTGDESAQNAVGELLVRGPGMFSGYHDGHGGVNSPFDADGWFHTGDAARRGEDGFFYFVDRIRDVIRRAGENVSPREVELVLCEHPAVMEAAVVGVSDPLRGQRIVGFVRLTEGYDADSDLLDAIREHARSELAYFKVPEGLEVVQDFPRTPTQRIQKHVLRGWAEAPNASN
jgi:crotonobetaine/carnitine-CoA ligase